ncbi:proteasome maturation protein [Klebsormidium nitens]|uniref:Proteasome maturation protein n=1 Tax=Klebsormidium nitens TaxID=105231 RepID=A0A1Y1I468_KLENI|nr:proteasome maturation protein [Klebsormidium nitens]|eukprot:GAQ85734.1 proteasome maturation protein [Klebsormidium nitens]
MEDSHQLPHAAEPHDALRFGLPTFKQDALPAHPVETMTKNFPKQQSTLKQTLLTNAYGAALPMRMEIERQYLSRPHRLPGMPDSRVSLDSMTGDLDNFGFEDYLNLPSERESQNAAVDPHYVMEARMGMVPKPSSILR